MSPSNIVTVAACVFAYSLLSRWLSDRSISGPMVFVGMALITAALDVKAFGGEFSGGGVEILAEASLVIVLFSDATRIDLRRLRAQAGLPSRLLGIGLPLTVLAGTGIAMLLFPDLGIFKAAVLAAILAPTDAALGQAVVSNPKVPIRVRQGLNVESGLNDGLMVPVVTILVALAAAEDDTATEWVAFVLRQIGFGVSAGVLVGALGAYLLSSFVNHNFVEGPLRQLAVLSIAVLAFGAAELFEGNGFVAAFIAGVAFGALARDECEPATDFTQNQGELLVLLTFFFWGGFFVAPRLDELTVEVAVYAILSLTVVRMLPVAIAMLGVPVERATIGYLGWFGPRGLASIIFGFFAVEHLEGTEAADTIMLVVTFTVLLSVVAHGLTAGPFAAKYGQLFATMQHDAKGDMPESVHVEPFRTRTRGVGQEKPDS